MRILKIILTSTTIKILYYRYQTQLTRGKHEKCKSIVAKGSASCFAFIGISIFDCCMDRTVLDFQGHMDSF